MADKDVLLSEFVGITGVDEDRAKFFLESSNWQLEMALEGFYDNETSESPDVQEVTADLAPTNPAAKTSSESPSSKKPIPKTDNKFATLSALNQQLSSSDEEGQAFYAGGSENSGQQVLGPPKKKDFVSEMFKSAQEHGAETIESTSSRHTSRLVFGGTGYKLGQTADDSVAVAGYSRPPAPSDVVLKFWRDGYSLDDGDLRMYTDPASRDFLESIRRGEIPQELIRNANGGEVHLNMEDHRHEEYTKSARKHIKPFTGQGHTLGSPAPPTVGACSDAVKDKDANERQAKKKLAVDKEKPVTNIQIRLTDGTKLVAEFNQSHTIADVRTFIATARPQYQMREFVLMTAYPSKELTNETDTLAGSGLLNATIMVRMK